MQVALQKKQLAVSLVEHFKEDHKNTIWVNFQFRHPKLNQKKCFMLCLPLRRKQLINSFVEQFQLTLENTKCFEFQFHVAKLSL